MKKIRVLNLYSGLGGNRKLWGDRFSVTAVELNESLCLNYKAMFPRDVVVMEDAHQYLLDHYMDFDVVWASPPCQSHSRVRFMAAKSGSYPSIYPDMKLWEEIIFLKHHHKCWAVENVVPYYEPLVKPTAKLGRHLIWASHPLEQADFTDGLTHNQRGSKKTGVFGDLPGSIKGIRVDQAIRNSVDPSVGLYILESIAKNLSGKQVLKKVQGNQNGK